MIIAQVCLRLVTIKGLSKICSFTVWGDVLGVQKQSTHLLRIELIRLLIVKCWSTPLQWRCKVAGYCQALEHTVVYADPEHPKHAQWVTCLVRMLAMQELGCFQLPGTVYKSLQHGAVHYHAETWGDGRGWMAQPSTSGSHHGISVHSNAINKMHLCFLSITYACPYHDSTTTMGHSIHNVDISKPLTHTRCLPSALYSENQDSSVKRTHLQSARRHWMWAFAHSSTETADRSRPRWGRRSCRWASLRRFLTVCAEIIWLCKPIVAAAVRVAGLRPSWRWRCWMWRSWAGVDTRGLQLWGRLDVLPNSLKRLWRWIMVEKWTFNSRATALVDIPVSRPIACSLKLATSLALCCVIKLHILEWPFIVTSLRHTSAIIMLSNQHLDMPHQWGGWFISAKEKCSLTHI